MVVGLFENIDHAEIALNNLAEAQFRNKDISVVMADKSQVKTISVGRGPLSGDFNIRIAKTLGRGGLSESDVENCRNLLMKGAVLIAVSGPAESDDAAAEMLADNGAVFVSELTGSI